MGPVFPIIVGNPRSGTTLLRAMLDSHPKLAVVNEAHFLVPMARNRRRFDSPQGFDLDSFLAALFADTGWVRLKLSQSDVEDAFRDSQVGLLADAIRVVFSTYAHSQGKTRYGEKTPNYVKHIPALADLLPEARFVHVVRDGRDVAASVLEAPFGPTTITEAAWSWRNAVSRGRRAGGRLGPSRYIEIRYEDLVEEPVQRLQGICSFLALDYTDEMLHYHRRAGELLDFTGNPGSQARLTEPPSRRRNWRTEMSEGDVRQFEAIAGRTLTDFGYETHAPAHLSLPALPGVLRWAAKRVLSLNKRVFRR